jgi:ABC-2 type transport system permease protein
MSPIPYLAVTAARFRLLLQYRLAAIGGLFTQLVFGLILIMVYEAFYRSSAAAPPIAFAQVTSYVWLSQALFASLPWNFDPELRELVRSGAVAYELCRPIDVYWLWYVRGVARNTASPLMRAGPLVVFAMVILPAIGLGAWRLAPPPSLAAGLGFVVAEVAALSLGAAMGTLLNIALMWTVVADGAQMLCMTLTSLLSGVLVPLPLLPAWSQTLIHWLPFAGLVDLPFRIYTGHVAADELVWVLARQLGWTAVLIVVGRLAMRRGLRRVAIEGG